MVHVTNLIPGSDNLTRRLAGKEGLNELKMTGFFAAVGDDWDEIPSRPPPREGNWVSFA
jgi:hypothetical protein